MILMPARLRPYPQHPDWLLTSAEMETDQIHLELRTIQHLESYQLVVHIQRSRLAAVANALTTWNGYVDLGKVAPRRDARLSDYTRHRFLGYQPMYERESFWVSSATTWNELQAELNEIVYMNLPDQPVRRTESQHWGLTVRNCPPGPMNLTFRQLFPEITWDHLSSLQKRQDTDIQQEVRDRFITEAQRKRVARDKERKKAKKDSLVGIFDLPF